MQKTALHRIEMVLKNLLASSLAVIAAGLVCSAASAQNSQGMRKVEVNPGFESSALSERGRRRCDDGSLCTELPFAALEKSGVFISEDDFNTLKTLAFAHGGYDAVRLWQEKDFRALESMSAAERAGYLNSLMGESSIGQDVQQAVWDAAGTLHKFEHRLKSPGSTYEAMHCRPGDECRIGALNDLVRYTALFEVKNYMRDTMRVINGLTSKGYRLHALWNAWTDRGYPYNGINTVMLSPEGQRFELQFHTAQGAAINDQTHEMYEQRRLQPKGSPEYRRILREQFALADKTVIPEGIGALVTFNHSLKSPLKAAV